MLDPVLPPEPLTTDRDDDYLVALAQMTTGVLVTGDGRLHDNHPPGLEVMRPQDFLQRLA